MSIVLILAAALAAYLVVLAFRRPATPLEHPDLPGLADVMRLAKRERGMFGLKWLRRSYRLQLAGIPLNILISENWPTLLAPGLRAIFHARLRARDELFKRAQIFNVQNSSRAYEDFQGIGELGTEMWNEFEKTGRTSYDSNVPGWTTRLEHREFTGGVVIRRKLIDDNMYPGAGLPTSINGRVNKLADSLAIFREKSAAEVFNNAFTDSGTDSAGFPIAGADGVGLVSTAHKRSPSDATTQSNEGTSALSKTAVKATALLMREFTDDRGELTAMHPDALLVPPELEDDAEVINRSAMDPESANNAVNPQAGRYKIVSWDYLTDANAWFMLDSMLRDEHLIWLERVAPEFQSAVDVDTQQAKYPAYNRFSRGFDAWQWLFGHNPS